MMDLYLRNGMIVTETGRLEGGIGIKDGVVAAVVHGSPDVAAKEVIEIDGRLVLPGIIDAHTHFSEPGREFEGYRSGSMAAAAGGITTVIDMPLNDLPPTTTRETHAAKCEMVKDQSVVDYALWGGLIDDNLAHLEELNEEGVVAFKAFMRTAKDYPRVKDDLLYAGLEKMKSFRNMVGVHAENDDVVAWLQAKLIAEGRTDRAAWNESRPCEEELEAINRAIFWARASGGNLYICHISFAEAVDLVRKSAFEGVSVTGETCAHYLFFDMEKYLEVGPRLKAAPPIRPREQVEALWDRVLRGHLDVISSDHSPFPPERYREGENNIWQGGGGVTGIQSILPAIMTEGVHKRHMPWELLVKMMSTNPARIFGIYPQKGAIMPGSDADLTIVDPDKEWVLAAEDLFYRFKESPYVGHRFKGAVERTIVRGKTVFHNGEIVAEPGHGKLIRRSAPAGHK